MSILAIIAALLLEQWRPVGERKTFLALLAQWIEWLERSFNSGAPRHGTIAWLVAVLPVAAAALALHALLYAAHPVLALLFNIGVLYLTLGFRQFSHYFTAIQIAIKEGDLERARELIGAWRGEAALPRSREEVIRLSIEEALLASHRHVFGVLFWYVLLPGPSGAIVYRMAALLCSRWRALGAFGEFAASAFYALEWPAVRLTATAFALVGDFEDAVYCWRTQARSWSDPNAGIVLAAGAGAMGARLGLTLQTDSGVEQARVELGVGEEADGALLDRTVGLLWRALVVWVFVLLLLSVALLLG